MIRVRWDKEGQCFRPFPAFLSACEQIEHGDKFQLDPEWSDEAHSHYFARLKELYDTLPESIASHFRNINHFRAWALVHEGFYNEFCQIEASPELAQHAAFTLRRYAPFAVVLVEGCVVNVRTAKSQSRKGGMSRKEWERSKQQVLELAEHLVNGGELDDAA